MEDFWWQISVNFPRKIGIKIVTKNFTPHSMQTKNCHLELTLGASSLTFFGPMKIASRGEGVNKQGWWAPRLLRSGGVLVEVFFFTVVWQLYCALVLRGCNCSAVLLLGSSHTTSPYSTLDQKPWPRKWQLTLSKWFQTNWQTPLNSDGLGAASQGVTTFAWRPGPGSQYDVAATRGADTVLASDCRAQFGRLRKRLEEGDIAFVCQYGCRSDRAERQCPGKQMRIPPFRCAPFSGIKMTGVLKRHFWFL